MGKTRTKVALAFFPGFNEPIGLLYLVSFLRSKGHQVALVNLGRPDYEDRISELNPELVGYSVIHGNHEDYIRANARLKRNHRFISIFGGPYPTYNPEMIHEPGIDVTCIGEGENALATLAGVVQDGKVLRTDIPNLSFKQPDGSVVANPIAPLIFDLDSLPVPDRDLFYKENEFGRVNGIKSFMTSRGCPFECSYCFNHLYKKIVGKGERLIRRHSVDRVLEEIGYVKKRYPLELVYFCDDIFILDRKWLEEFSEKYPRKIGVRFFCTVRSNLLTEDVAKMLKEAGCYSVSMSIDSGDEFIRNSIFRRNISEEQIVSSCRLLRKYSIKAASNIILGAPYSTLETELETLRLVRKSQPSSVTWTFFQPYKGLVATEKAIEGGFFDGDYSKIKGSFYGDIPLDIPQKEERRMLANFLQFFYAFNIPEFFIRMIIQMKNRKLFSVFRVLVGMAMFERIFGHRKSLREILLTLAFLNQTNSIGLEKEDGGVSPGD